MPAKGQSVLNVFQAESIHTVVLYKGMHRSRRSARMPRSEERGGMAAHSEAEANSLLVYKSPAWKGGVLYFLLFFDASPYDNIGRSKKAEEVRLGAERSAQVAPRCLHPDYSPRFL